MTSLLHYLQSIVRGEPPNSRPLNLVSASVDHGSSHPPIAFPRASHVTVSISSKVGEVVANRKIIFYDFEVFKHLWLVVIIDYETRKKCIIVNDSDRLKRFYDRHTEDIWVGYNSRNYDQCILKGILAGLDPWEISDQLINQDKKGYYIIPDFDKYQLYNFDISTGFHSLKQLEGFMGSTIKESSVPFDLDRPLTEDEKQEVIKYCIHDVEQTIEVFDNRREEFDSQMSLIEAFNLPMSMLSRTKAQLSAHVLGATRRDWNDEFNITLPDTLKISKYQHIVDWYKDPKNRDYNKKLVIDVAGVPHVFAWGGLHGAIDNYFDEGIILCCDVSSLYPAIMIEYGFLSRNVTNPNKYRDMRDTRLKLKAAKNPMQLPYKIVLKN